MIANCSSSCSELKSLFPSFEDSTTLKIEILMKNGVSGPICNCFCFSGLSIGHCDFFSRLFMWFFPAAHSMSALAFDCSWLVLKLMACIEAPEWPIQACQLPSSPSVCKCKNRLMVFIQSPNGTSIAVCTMFMCAFFPFAQRSIPIISLHSRIRLHNIKNDYKTFHNKNKKRCKCFAVKWTQNTIQAKHAHSVWTFWLKS